MDREEILAWVKTLEWRFAKSMAAIPHWYSIKWWLEEDAHEKYANFARLIQSEGVDERFYSKTYRYLYLDGFKYWTMSDPILKSVS